MGKPLFLEIGGSDTPVYQTGEIDLDGFQYLGIDLNFGELLEFAERVSQGSRLSIRGFLNFVQGWGDKLPVRSNSAEIVYLGNVMGATVPSGHSQEVLLNECRRVVKNTGKLVFVETYTPDRLRPEVLIRELPRFNFRSTKLIKPSDSEWSLVYKDYLSRSTPENAPHDAFVLYAKPS